MICPKSRARKCQGWESNPGLCDPTAGILNLWHIGLAKKLVRGFHNKNLSELLANPIPTSRMTDPGQQEPQPDDS